MLSLISLSPLKMPELRQAKDVKLLFQCSRPWLLMGKCPVDNMWTKKMVPSWWKKSVQIMVQGNAQSLCIVL